MKTYLLSIINRIQHLSKTLDAKAIVSNKEWIVFNDSGDRESLIFKQNGELRIISNGMVTDAKWEFEPTNDSLLISTSHEKIMVFPAFYNDQILALKQEVKGTPQYAFLIKRVNYESFRPQTLSELQKYFEEIEIQELERLEEEKTKKEKENALKRQKELQESINQKKREERLSKTLKYLFILLIIGLLGYYFLKGMLFLYYGYEYGYSQAQIRIDHDEVASFSVNTLIAKDYNKESNSFTFFDTNGNALNNGESFCGEVTKDKLGNYQVIGSLISILDTNGVRVIDRDFYEIKITQSGLYNCKEFDSDRESWRYYDRKGFIKCNKKFNNSNSLEESNIILYYGDTICAVDNKLRILDDGYIFVGKYACNDDVLIVRKKGKYGLVNRTLYHITSFDFEAIDNEGIFMKAKKNGVWGTLDDNGTWTPEEKSKGAGLWNYYKKLKETNNIPD